MSTYIIFYTQYWNSTTKVVLLLGEEITSVACSDKHVVVAANGNKVFSWGRNEDGCLGLGGMYVADTI